MSYAVEATIYLVGGLVLAYLSVRLLRARLERERR